MEALKERRFFTFCYIPLVPYSFDTVVKCSICNYTQKTDKEQLESVKRNEGKAGTAPVQGYYV